MYNTSPLCLDLVLVTPSVIPAVEIGLGIIRSFAGALIGGSAAAVRPGSLTRALVPTCPSDLTAKSARLCVRRRVGILAALRNKVVDDMDLVDCNHSFVL
jgi:hypothetical protein